MYKILIVDDETQSRKNTQTALISVAENKLFQDERFALAERHFKIEKFAIAGAAINHVKENEGKNMPDLALLDISFAKLTVDFVKDEGFDPKIEIKETRGFDVYDAVANHTQPILFTAYADVHEAIGNELVKRRQLNYVSILSKATGINFFSLSIADNLDVIANQLLTNANNRNFEELAPLLAAQNRNQDMIFAARIWLDGREFTVQNFFIYKFYLSENGRDLIPQEGILEYIDAFFKPFINNNIEQQMPMLLGNWTQDWVQAAIVDFKRHGNYTNLNNIINVDAANCILELLETSHNANLQFLRYRQRVRRKTLGNAVRIFGDIPWTAIFGNALMDRRVFIGLNSLANNQIWSVGVNQTKSQLLSFIMEKVGWANTRESIAFHLTTQLGLSIAEDNADLQRFNTGIDYILQEEQDFLKTFVPQILQRMQNLNGHQPNPIYTPFE